MTYTPQLPPRQKFSAGADMTASRTLGTTFTAGATRRQVTVTVKVTTQTGATAVVGTWSAKQAGVLVGPEEFARVLVTDTVGGGLAVTVTVNETRDMTAVFVVDPAGTYVVSMPAQTNTTVAIASWAEADE